MVAAGTQLTLGEEDAEVAGVALKDYGRGWVEDSAKPMGEMDLPQLSSSGPKGGGDGVLAEAELVGKGRQAGGFQLEDPSRNGPMVVEAI